MGEPEVTEPDMSEPAAAAGRDLRPTRRRLWIAVGVALPIAMLVAVLASGSSTGSRVVKSPLLGKPVPEVVTTTIDGKAFDMRELRGKWVLVNFFATWCVECVREHSDLVRFHDTHTNLGDAGVVGVVYSDSIQAVKEFRDDEGGRWPMLDDPKGRIALDFGVAAVPESFLVDPSGRVVSKILAGVQLEVIERLMAGRDPNTG